MRSTDLPRRHSPMNKPVRPAPCAMALRPVSAASIRADMRRIAELAAAVIADQTERGQLLRMGGAGE